MASLANAALYINCMKSFLVRLLELSPVHSIDAGTGFISIPASTSTLVLPSALYCEPGFSVGVY